MLIILHSVFELSFRLGQNQCGKFLTLKFILGIFCKHLAPINTIICSFQIRASFRLTSNSSLCGRLTCVQRSVRWESVFAIFVFVFEFARICMYKRTCGVRFLKNNEKISAASLYRCRNRSFQKTFNVEEVQKEKLMVF